MLLVAGWDKVKRSIAAGKKIGDESDTEKSFITCVWSGGAIMSILCGCSILVIEGFVSMFFWMSY